MNAPAVIPQVATMRSADLPAMLSAFGGGYLTAIIVHEGKHFALITAGKDGEFTGQYHHRYTDIPGAKSYIDGLANTIAMVNEGSKLAIEVRGYRGGDFDDWAIPAPYQMEAQYRYLKPTTDENDTWLNGANPYLLIPGLPYTDATPAQTTLAEFQEGGEHAFAPEYYLSSAQYSAYDAFVQGFKHGHQRYGYKYGTRRVRAVRMIQLTD